jgi:DNA-binding NtrC family response regulator
VRCSALIVTSNPAVAHDLGTALVGVGPATHVVASVRQAAAHLRSGPPPRLLLIDAVLSDGDALDLLKQQPAVPVPALVLASPEHLDTAQAALQQGAIAIVPLPVDITMLRNAVTLALGPTTRPGDGAQRRPAGPSAPFLGLSPAARTLAADADRVAKTDVSILIQGETGSGKGVLARWIHERSNRGAAPFVDVNCAAMSKDLFESEMCGFERGAFTGASAAKVGLLEAADRGTMFLDEIGDLDLEIQPRMLKLIEEKRCRRLGSVREIDSNVRFIAATNHDLTALARERRFRSDLLFRLNTITLVCPPLRDRADDTIPLAERRLASLSQELSRPRLSLSRDAAAALIAYPWPGNIRELLHVIERAALMTEHDVIDVDDLRLSTSQAADDGDIAGDRPATLENVQLRHILSVLDAEGWNVENAARSLGMPRSTLYQKIKQHGLVRPALIRSVSGPARSVRARRSTSD